jgi:Phosphodiester glycosidase
MIGKSRRARWARRALVVLLVPLAAAGGYVLWTYHGPAPETEIYRGLFYCCEALPNTPQSSGLVHWVRADLNVPGVSLFVTPLDADAVAHGWQYRLQFTMSAVADQHLAAAVNGTMFASDSNWFRWPGDLARSGETVVADHVVSHVDPNSYLLWWDDGLIAHLKKETPPSSFALAHAKWAIGSQMPLIVNGQVNTPWSGTDVDHRTLIGADPEGRRVWIACFDRASATFAGEYLVKLGASLGVTVDGGISTAMAIGSDAVGVRGGRVVGDFRPVATQFGFRAAPLAKRP